MNKRCIVNVATGEFYCKMQERLIESFGKCIHSLITYYPDGVRTSGSKMTNTKGIDLITWNDCLPIGSGPHSESPYGFKVWAIKAAYEMGYTSILWLDSPAYAVKEDISPIFDKIEKEGYYVMSHIDPLTNYVGDRALAYYEIERDDLVDDNLVPLNLPSGSCYGFHFGAPRISSVGRGLFEEMFEAEKDGLFKSEIVGNIVHRHDEAILALNLIRFDRPCLTFDPLFQSDSPECVIKSGGL